VTLGEPCLHQTLSLNGMRPKEILAIAACAERSSEHPLARSIVSAAYEAGLDVDVPQDFQALPGHGVRATVREQSVAIGQRMLEHLEVDIPEDVQAQVGELQATGHTVVPVAVDGTVVGLLVIADTVREESRQAVTTLKALGMTETILISGDNQAVANAVGEALGVDRIYAETLPEQKLTLIRELQQQGHKVAFVGDGVNDAPALAAADVGIAMGGMGTNVAMETADVVLLTDHLERLPYLVALSRTTLRIIRNNVIFAMGMNVLSVVLSVGGVIGPVVGAVMHEVSALPVVANSARLIGWKGWERMQKEIS
jgi:Cd2+/Zn2+-exporting ATPase